MKILIVCSKKTHGLPRQTSPVCRLREQMPSSRARSGPQAAFVRYRV